MIMQINLFIKPGTTIFSPQYLVSEYSDGAANVLHLEWSGLAETKSKTRAFIQMNCPEEVKTYRAGGTGSNRGGNG